MELESLVGGERITSKTFVTPERGERKVAGGVTVADSAALGLLASL